MVGLLHKNMSIEYTKLTECPYCRQPAIRVNIHCLFWMPEATRTSLPIACSWNIFGFNGCILKLREIPPQELYTVFHLPAEDLPKIYQYHDVVYITKKWKNVLTFLFPYPSSTETMSGPCLLTVSTVIGCRGDNNGHAILLTSPLTSHSHPELWCQWTARDCWGHWFVAMVTCRLEVNKHWSDCWGLSAGLARK